MRHSARIVTVQHLPLTHIQSVAGLEDEEDVSTPPSINGWMLLPPLTALGSWV
jgi:hypothetical protein